MGDGAYDYTVCYKANNKRGARPIIPPKAWGKPQMKSRDENIKVLRRVGLAECNKRANYHRRNLVAMAMMGLKIIISEKLKGRRFDRQAV